MSENVKKAITVSLSSLCRELAQKIASKEYIVPDDLIIQVLDKTAEALEVALTPETITYTKVNIPDPNYPGDRIVGFRITKEDSAYGDYGLTEPLAWLDTLYQLK